MTERITIQEFQGIKTMKMKTNTHQKLKGVI